jgi:hypothetical protein
MNVHWMILYKLYVFWFDMKFKMAATPGLSLTLDPMGKMFQNNDQSWAVWFELSKWFQRRGVLKHFSHRVQC